MPPAAEKGSARARARALLGGGARGLCACAGGRRRSGLGSGRDGGRERTGRRTVADEVRHGARRALRVVPQGDAGASGRAALPAVGAGGLHAGGLPSQGALPAARELPQQQAQRPQRVSAPWVLLPPP